jgi:hypothetical protein
MRIGQATGTGQDLRMSSFRDGGILTVEMTWAEWDELVKDAEYLRNTGRFRDRPSTDLR